MKAKAAAGAVLFACALLAALNITVLFMTCEECECDYKQSGHVLEKQMRGNKEHHQDKLLAQNDTLCSTVLQRGRQQANLLMDKSLSMTARARLAYAMNLHALEARQNENDGTVIALVTTTRCDLQQVGTEHKIAEAQLTC